MTISIPDPELQASFAAALSEIRTLYLQDALREAVNELAVPTIDKELAELVPAHSLTALASHGLRGEMMFPVPVDPSDEPAPARLLSLALRL